MRRKSQQKCRRNLEEK